MTPRTPLNIVITMLLFSGCHCFQVSERYGDRIDRFADRGCCLDRFYREDLDLTRICWGGKACGGNNCPPVAVYPESKVQHLPATAPSEPQPKTSDPGLDPMPSIPEPLELPPVDSDHSSPVPAPPPLETEVSKRVIPITIEGNVEDLTAEQLAALLKQAQGEIRQTSAAVTTPPPMPTALESEAIVPEATASAKPTGAISQTAAPALQKTPQKISAPAGVPPAPRSVQ